jgi:hypothetical protein
MIVKIPGTHEKEQLSLDTRPGGLVAQNCPEEKHVALRLDLSRLHLVHVAPNPRLPWLDRANQRVMNLVKVLGRVLVFGRVAASYMPARQAQPQVYPRVPHLYAFFTDMLLGISDFYLIEMGTLIFHDASW